MKNFVLSVSVFLILVGCGFVWVVGFVTSNGQAAPPLYGLGMFLVACAAAPIGCYFLRVVFREPLPYREVGVSVGYRYLFFSAFIVVVIVGLVEMGVGSFLAFRVRQSAELPPGVNSVTAVQVPTLPQKKKPSMKMSPEMGQVALIKSGLRDETAVPRPTAPGSALATPTEGPVLPQAEIPPPPSSVVGGGSVKIIPLVVEPGPMPVTVPHVKPDSSMAVSDMPEVLLRPQPEYPQGAVRHHIEGAVSVEIVVGHDGSVISVLGVTHHLAEGPLRRSFDDAAIKAAKGMKFVPVVDRLGRPTTLACIVSVEFRLPS